MSSVSRFLLAIITIFIVGMTIDDPDTTNRPVQLREAALGFVIVERHEE